MAETLEHAAQGENRFSPPKTKQLWRVLFRSLLGPSHQSFEASGAAAVGAGASWTGAAEVCFGAAGFLVVPAPEADVAGRGDGNGALAGGPDDGGARAADGPAAALGSGDMMLIAGVEAAE